MTGERGFHFIPIHRTSGGRGPVRSQPFILHELRVVGTLAVCDVDKTPTPNALPSISVKITQYVRLADESLIRLDLDRGFTSVRHGAGTTVSWKRTTSDLIAEILDLVGTDDEDHHPGSHPWEQLAEAARRRGIDVSAATLSELPYQVLLTAEVASLFEL